MRLKLFNEGENRTNLSLTLAFRDLRMIPKETIAQIVDAAEITDVVGDYVSLKRRGANYLGLCPFHNERTPSFTVSPSKGIYKCFGCGKSGTSVNFIMEHEQMSYPEALKHLAKKYGIQVMEEVQSDEQKQEERERESMMLITAYAQKVFSSNLSETDEGRIGLSYFKERGFNDHIINDFQLGYSFEQRDAFTKRALKEGYNETYLVATGLVIKSERDGRLFDRFAGRVMFPIHNLSGKVIAFGGRILTNDKNTAKYLNSPESLIYHKSNVLYGIFQSKKSIVEKDNCYLAEGYTDVLSLHQAGITNVVASSGTSLTAEQIRLIRRFSKNITVLYDGDKAGIKAALRGIDMILSEGMNVKVFLFPDGDDPDSFARKTPTAELFDVLENHAQDFISFKTNLLLEDAAGNPVKKAELIKDVIQTISLIPEPFTRSEYIKQCSKLLETNEQLLINEVNKLIRKSWSKESFKAADSNDGAPNADEVPQDLITEEKHERQVVELIDAGYEVYERNIIRLLINYGGEIIDVPTQLNETGVMDYWQTLLSNYIRFSLTKLEYTFENAVYQELYNEYLLSLDREEVPEAAYFIAHTNRDIQQLAIDLCHEPYELSRNWEEKYNLYIQTEKDKLLNTVENALLHFELKLNTAKIKVVQEALKNSENEDALIQHMADLILLREKRKIITEKLGIVISV
jgi:DNA primase